MSNDSIDLSLKLVTWSMSAWHIVSLIYAFESNDDDVDKLHLSLDDNCNIKWIKQNQDRRDHIIIDHISGPNPSNQFHINSILITYLFSLFQLID
ncbi:hypothetical protein DERP_001891 [Dermatophagoides pteronyssinus]|uniref:Uncharacterized protein n=1 Tax=Dermatophagoides pteronyssinus TaxID=6956 RepID=A0ABQ8JCB4_DERPT|nr:hypothetical protein DERP_001891 [Dermatophagoides pteronyssinus]